MLNLLPPAYRKELKRAESFRLALILGALVLVFFLCLSLLLLSIRIYVSGVINEQKILVEAETQEYEREEIPGTNIPELNQNIGKVSIFYERSIYVSSVLEEIADAFPAGSHLDSFQYIPQENTAKISLSGFAPTTEDLVDLRAKLEENERFSNFFFPPSNWVPASDVQFSFTFEIAI